MFVCVWEGGRRKGKGGLFLGLEDGRIALKECSSSVGKTVVFSLPRRV